MSKNWKMRAFLAYSLAFLMLGGVLVLIFFFTGRSMIEGSDAAFQHYPVLCYIRKYIRQIGRGLLFEHRLIFPMVDYRIGQGMDVLTTLNYYGLGDPLTVLSAFAPESCMVGCYGLLILLRLYLCGAAFLLYCFEVKTGNWASSAAGAIAYCFSTFSLYAGFKHPMFLNGPLYLPLLLFGTERALRRKKTLLLCIFTALCLCSNFYFAYMNTIIAGCYILIRLFWMRECPARVRLRQLLRLALAYICGMGLSAAVFLPVVYAFWQNGRVVGETSQNQLSVLYRAAQYREYLEQLVFATPGGSSWTCFGFSALFVPAVVVLFAHRANLEQRRWIRPLRTGVVLCAVLICFPIVGKAMNGFSYVANRWFFAGAFVAALTVTYLLPEFLRLTKAELAAMAGVSLLYAAVVLFLWDEELNLYHVAIVCCISAALLAACLGSAGARRKRGLRFPWMPALFCLAVLSSGLHICGMFFPQFGKYIYRFVSLDNIRSLYTDAAVDGMPLLDEAQGQTFARVDRASSTGNRTLMDDLKSHGYYFSMSPAALAEFYRSLSLNTLQYSDLFRGQGGRTILDEITATRYYTTTEAGRKWAPYGYSLAAREDESREDGAVILENDYFLPLGFTYASYVSREAYEALEEEKRQQLLLQCAVLETEIDGIAKREPGNLAYSVAESEVSFRNTKAASYKKHKLRSAGEGAVLRLDFDVPPGREAYLMLKGIRSDRRMESVLEVLQDGYQERVMALNPENKLWFGHDIMLVNLGYSEEARTGCTLKFDEKWHAVVDEIRVFSCGMENYAAQVKALGEDVLQNTEVEGNRISGEITLDEGKLLYLSIPYSKGWSAYVDGKKADVLKANLTYMAVALEAGRHTLVFRYETPYLRLGLLISGLSAAGMLFFEIFRKRRRNGDLYEKSGTSQSWL